MMLSLKSKQGAFATPHINITNHEQNPYTTPIGLKHVEVQGGYRFYDCQAASVILVVLPFYSVSN